MFWKSLSLETLEGYKRLENIRKHVKYRRNLMYVGSLSRKPFSLYASVLSLLSEQGEEPAGPKRKGESDEEEKKGQMTSFFAIEGTLSEKPYTRAAYIPSLPCTCFFDG